jgi:hypothetical protein
MSGAENQFSLTRVASKPAARQKSNFPSVNKREGFDIRAVKLLDEATGAMEVRRVEVKGRKRVGSVVLTTNEWSKAQQLGEHYWLYVV